MDEKDSCLWAVAGAILGEPFLAPHLLQFFQGTWPGCHKGTPSHQISLTATSIHSTTTGRTGSPSRIRGRSHTWTGPPATQRVSLAQAQMERACIQWGHAMQGTMPGEARGITWPSLPSNGRGHQTHRKGTPPGSSIVKHIAATREMHQAGQAASTQS